MQACWKPSWSLASLAWLNKELRHWKTVCLPAFVCTVRCQYRNSSVSEESERSMVRKGECNWITMTLGWPFITRTHTHTHTVSPVPQTHTCSITNTHAHTRKWPLSSLVYSLIWSKHFLSFTFLSLGMLQWCAHSWSERRIYAGYYFRSTLEQNCTFYGTNGACSTFVLSRSYL